MTTTPRKIPSKVSPSKAPAPRWERKAEERPEALFEAAITVFSDRGYRATRLEEVAEAAGVSKGTVYRYFLNKEDLLEKALDHRRNLGRAQEALFGLFLVSPDTLARVALGMIAPRLVLPGHRLECEREHARCTCQRAIGEHRAATVGDGPM